MADFTQWGYAAAPAIEWAEDDFRLAYRATRREAQHAVIDSDPVAAGILTLVHGPEQQGKPRHRRELEPSRRYVARTVPTVRGDPCSARVASRSRLSA